MAATAELVSQLRANLSHGCRLKDAEKVLHLLQDELLVPRGLYLNGGLHHFGDGSDLSPEIVGLVTRADGRDLSERDLIQVTTWLGKQPAITEFSMGPLKPADSPEFMPIGTEQEDDAPSNE
jgi:uncharacterized protein YggL (DUF469 family)